MTKEKFCEILKKIDDTWELESKIYGLVWNYDNKYKEDINMSGMFVPLASEVVGLLAEIMQDECEDISYFCYELDFGRDWKPGMVVDKNGRDINFSTAENLYDYLEEQRNKR